MSISWTSLWSRGRTWEKAGFLRAEHVRLVWLGGLRSSGWLEPGESEEAGKAREVAQSIWCRTLRAGAGISDCIFIDTRSHCRYNLMCFKTLTLPAHVEKGQQGGYTSRSSQEIEITPGISGWSWLEQKRKKGVFSASSCFPISLYCLPLPPLWGLAGSQGAKEKHNLYKADSKQQFVSLGMKKNESQ